MDNLKPWEEYVLYAGFMNYTATAIVKLLAKCDINVDEEKVIQCFETNKQRIQMDVTMNKTYAGASLLGARTVFYFSYMPASSTYTWMRALGFEITLPEINGHIESFHKLEEIKNRMNGRPGPEYILQAYALGFTVEEIWVELNGPVDRIPSETDIKAISKMIRDWMIRDNGFTKETVPAIRRLNKWNPRFERWIELSAELGLFSNYSVAQILVSGYTQVKSRRINAILDKVEKRTNKSCNFSMGPKKVGNEEQPKRPRLE